MICRKLRFKKQIISLLMTAVMTTSAFAGTGAITYADDKKADNTVTNLEEKESKSEKSGVDLDVDSHFMGDLSKVDAEFDNAITSEELLDKATQDCAVPKAGANESLPQAVDNSTSIYFPEIGDQDHVGSCVSWSEVYYGFTYANCRAKNLPATGDNIMSPAFVYNQIKSYSGGSYPEYALEILSAEGAPSMNTADFESYKQESLCKTWFPEKEIWLEAEKTRLSSYAFVSEPDTISSNDDEDLDELKELLNDGFLINCSTLPNGWIGAKCDESGTHAGELIVKKAVKASGGHRMVIVGYDDNVCVDINEDGIIEDAEKGAFKIVNSWGKDWGNDGFIWFSYDSLNKISQAIRPLPNRMRSLYDFSVQYVEQDAQPCSGVNLVMKINTKARCDMEIVISATDEDGNEISECFPATVVNNWLKCSLNGSNKADDGVVLFDLNNVIEDITAQKVGDYMWTLYIHDAYNDSSLTILKDAYIEADGETVFDFDSNEIIANGNRCTKSWTNNKYINIDWDIEGNDSTVGAERTITADVIGNSSDDVQYKFVDQCYGRTTVLKDYSPSNECTFIPKYTGLNILHVYANVNGEVIEDRTVFTINEKPLVENIKYTPSNYYGELTANYLGEEFGMEAVVYGGTGNSKIEEIYVIGGNYEDGPHRIELNLSGDLTARWAADKEGDYTLYVKVKDESGVTSEVVTETFTIKPARPMRITDLSDSSYSTADLFEMVKFSAEAEGGSGKYEYRFGTIFNDKEYEISDGYIDASEVEGRFGLIGSSDGVTESTALVGENTLFVDVRDKVTGEVLRKTKGYKVYGMQVSTLSANKRDCLCNVGNELEVWVPVRYASPDGYNEKRFSYVFDGVETVFDDSTQSHISYGEYECASFVPQKAGVYTIKFHAVDAIGQEVNMQMPVEVTGYKAVVYYDNASWNNAYIHYCVDGEKWTKVPGVQMEKSDVEGYKWKFEIDLSNHPGAQVCFNNGNNSWDSCNGNNYRVGKGTYYIKNGNVSKQNISMKLEYDDRHQNFCVTGIVNNSSNKVKCKRKIYIDGSLYQDETTIETLYHGQITVCRNMYIEGTYRIELEIEDENGDKCIATGEFYSPGEVLELTPDKEGSYKVGETFTVNMKKINNYIYGGNFNSDIYWYVQQEDGTYVYETGRSWYYNMSFTPTKVGTYTVICYIPDEPYGPVIQTLDITVTDEPDNTVVVYYNNSNWSDANIHYCVDNGSWTAVPGVAMQPSDNPKYTWKYVIVLGDEISAQVCFNNGKGWWDSRNGANYRLNAGTYCIANGMIYNA